MSDKQIGNEINQQQLPLRQVGILLDENRCNQQYDGGDNKPELFLQRMLVMVLVLVLVLMLMLAALVMMFVLMCHNFSLLTFHFFFLFGCKVTMIVSQLSCKFLAEYLFISQKMPKFVAKYGLFKLPITL